MEVSAIKHSLTKAECEKIGTHLVGLLAHHWSKASWMDQGRDRDAGESISLKTLRDDR